MARKKKTTWSTSPNIIGRAWDFIALSLLTPITKVKKPVFVRCRDFFLLKRAKRRLISTLPRHYNYGRFIIEYEFSPSSTPLFGRHSHSHPHRPLFKKKAGARLLSLLICGSNIGTESVIADDEVDALSVVGDGFERDPYDDDGDGSIDLRAEKFIERFYEEMRINLRRRSL